MRRNLLRNEQGGAVVELAVFTMVIIPLAFYGIWIGDALHIGIRAQEASVTPVFDSTAALVHSFTSGGGSKASAAVSHAQQQIMNDMSGSFDPAKPGASRTAQSLIAKPNDLEVKCEAKGPSMVFDVNESNNYQPTKTWVTCTAQAAVTLSNVIPKQYIDDQVGTQFLPSSIFNLHLCGIGPGITGCGKGGNQGGLPIYLDDWGTETGQSNPLGGGANKGYWNVAKLYYTGAATPAPVMAMVAGLGDLASTPSYRLTYQRVESTGAYTATEGGQGQSGPHGGPQNPHTGGAWHDESSPTNLDENTFNNRANQHYMAFSGWPAD